MTARRPPRRSIAAARTMTLLLLLLAAVAFAPPGRGGARRLLTPLTLPSASALSVGGGGPPRTASTATATTVTASFAPRRDGRRAPLAATDDDGDGGGAPDPGRDARDEAERLFALAREIREGLPPDVGASAEASAEAATESSSATDAASWADASSAPSAGYRLYVDVGREPGTWMDPRWGASGARIEFSVDVSFRLPPGVGVGVGGGADAEGASDGGEGGGEGEGEGGRGGRDPSLADEEVRGRMVKDNFGGRSSAVRVVDSAPYARLRGGFDRMSVRGGGYRVDVGGRRRGDATVRFHLLVDGSPAGPDSTYGDVCVPGGCLHFSIPCFGGSVENLSSREGPVTVRQVGWHTGWRREESRIVGTFRARPIAEARRRDGY